MNRCPSCGGLIGRDCFNPVECARITENLRQQDYQSADSQIIQQLQNEINHLREVEIPHVEDKLSIALDLIKETIDKLGNNESEKWEHYEFIHGLNRFYNENISYIKSKESVPIEDDGLPF